MDHLSERAKYLLEQICDGEGVYQGVSEKSSVVVLHVICLVALSRFLISRRGNVYSIEALTSSIFVREIHKLLNSISVQDVASDEKLLIITRCISKTLPLLASHFYPDESVPDTSLALIRKLEIIPSVIPSSDDAYDIEGIYVYNVYL